MLAGVEPEARPFCAEHERDTLWPQCVLEIDVSVPGEADAPETSLADLFERPGKVDDADPRHALQRSRRRLGKGTALGRGMAILRDDSDRPEGRRGTKDRADIVRVGDLVEHQKDRALLCLVQQPVEPHVLERLDLDDDALMRRVGRNQSSKVRRLRHGHGDLLGQLHVIRGLAGGPRSKHLAIGIVERRGDRMPAPQSRPVRGAVALVGFLAARHRWRA